MNLDQEKSTIADELATKLRGNVVGGHGGRPSIAAEEAKLLREVGGQRGLIGRQRGDDVDRFAAESSRELSQPSPDLFDLVTGTAWPGLHRDDVETPAKPLQGAGQSVEVEGRRRADPNSLHEGSEISDHLLLEGLVIGNQQERAVHGGHRGQALEGVSLAAELGRGRCGRQCREARPAMVVEDLSLPEDRFGAAGLKIQQVVVELDPADGAEREQRGNGGDEEHDSWMTAEGTDQEGTDALRRGYRVRDWGPASRARAV